MSGLAINLAFWSEQPTGLTTYARNLLPYLAPLKPPLFSPVAMSGFTTAPVPTHLGSDKGTKGHVQRLLWYQTGMPKPLRNLKSSLLFSPVPEAPLHCPCPYIVTVHDLIPLRFPEYSAKLKAYFQFYVPLLLKGAQHILCDSEATAMDVVHFYRIPRPKMTVIPLAHDAHHFRVQGLPKQNYFLCLARHDPHKNLGRVIQAFSQMPTEVELWIAGPATVHTPGLKALVAQHYLTERVKFLDYIPYAQLPSVIEQALALVFPSLWEGFGLPVLEAMACGTPVITSKSSSLPEVAGDAALLVNPESIEELQCALQQILSNPQLQQNLIQRGLHQAQKFSWERTGAATVSVLQTWM